VAYSASLGVTVARVMTDNGSCYRSKAFRKAGSGLGLKHIFTKPYTPKTNGKAERFVQTTLREGAYAQAYPSSDHRAAKLPIWLRRCNHWAGSDANLLFVTSPGRALRAQSLAPNAGLPVVGSGAISSNTFTAICASGVFAVVQAPEIRASCETVLHMDDTPTGIGISSSGVFPTRSLWQTDTTALLVVMLSAPRCCWPRSGCWRAKLGTRS
jgi:hypothetical protein